MPSGTTTASLRISSAGMVHVVFVLLPHVLSAVALVAAIHIVPPLSSPPPRPLPAAVTHVPAVFAEPGPPSVDADEPWQPPVDAPIVDFFRAPSHRYGPGNRGLEYGTRRGQWVKAVADGTVIFAGQVGGRLFVVVAHGHALRSTYAYLDRLLVTEGESVARGRPVATAAPGFHLTARHHGRYIDPLPLFGWQYRVRLVPSRVSSAPAAYRSNKGGFLPRRAI